VCDGIVHGPQFLDTAKYPEITFRSEQVRVKDPGSLEVIGKLTLHGVTRPVVLDTKFNGGYAGHPGDDPQARIGFSAHGSLKQAVAAMGLHRRLLAASRMRVARLSRPGRVSIIRSSEFQRIHATMEHHDCGNIPTWWATERAFGSWMECERMSGVPRFW